MATVTDPIILDSTGQAIKNSIDLLSANINRTASNIPYDSNLTIKGKIDAIEDEIDTKVSKTGDTMTGDLIVNRPSATTSYQDAYVTVGNDIAEGNVGNSRGILRIYDRNQNSVMMYPDNVLTATRYVNFPNKSGTMALTSDINCMEFIPLNQSDDGRYYYRTFSSITKTRTPIFIMRCHQSQILSPPIVYGRIDGGGNVYFDSSGLATFDSVTKKITVDNASSAWASGILVAPKGYFVPN